MNYTILILIIVATMFLANSFRIAPDNQRFAIFILGKYTGLRGPGLLLRWPGSTQKWIRIKVGDKGELDAPEIGAFHEVQLPLKMDKNIDVGSKIRVIGFTESHVLVMMDPDQRTTIKCEKCGHEMQL